MLLTRLDLAQVDITKEAIGPQVLDEPLGVDLVRLAGQPLTGCPELVGIQLACKAKDLGIIEPLGPYRPQVIGTQHGVVFRFERPDRDPVAALRQKIEAKDRLIRKWKGQAEACDPSNDVGRAVQRYCRGLARWQEEQRDRLESEMRVLTEREN